MNSQRKFIKNLLLTLPPIKTEKFLQMMRLPRSNYKVMHGLYVDRLCQQEVADLIFMSLETVKRRNAEGLDIILKSLDAVDLTQF